jgi:hypothetical protein
VANARVDAKAKGPSFSVDWRSPETQPADSGDDGFSCHVNNRSTKCEMKIVCSSHAGFGINGISGSSMMDPGETAVSVLLGVGLDALCFGALFLASCDVRSLNSPY